MPLSIAQFWQLLAASKLHSTESIQRLQAQSKQHSGSDGDSVKHLAQWLISQRAITLYQAKVLLAGRSGPFFLGNYRIENRLDQGRFAGLFQALNTQASTKVLLRSIPSATIASPAAKSALQSTAAKAQKIHSPKVSRFDGLLEVGGNTLAIGEDLSGAVSLAEQFSTTRSWTEDESLQLTEQLALGLAAFHQQQVAYGNVQPDNIMVLKDQSVKLLQFPLLLDAQTAENPSATKDNIYWPSHIAQMPENDHASLKNDLYALGVVLFQLLSSNPRQAAQNPLFDATSIDRLTVHATSKQLLKRLLLTAESEPIVSATELLDILKSLRTSLNSPEEIPIAQVVSPPESKSTDSVVSPTPKTPPGSPVRSDTPSFDFLNSFEAVEAEAGVKIHIDGAASPSQVVPQIVVDPTPVHRSAVSQKSSPKPKSRSASRASTELQGVEEPRKKASSRLWAGIAAGVAVCLLLGFVALWALRGTDQAVILPGDQPANSTTQAQTTTSVLPQDPQAMFLAIADDGKTLWAAPDEYQSPTAIDLRYCMPGAQALLFWRPSSFLQQIGVSDLQELIGPGGEYAQQHIETVTSLKLEEIQQLVFVIYTREDGSLGSAMRVLPDTDLDPDTILQRWQNSTKGEYNETPIWTTPTATYAFPSSEIPNLFIVGETAAIQTILGMQDSPTIVRREIQEVLEHIDGTRDFIGVTAPEFLFSDGRELLAQTSFTSIGANLQKFLGYDLKAIGLSLKVGEEAAFIELRAAGNIRQNPRAIANVYLNQLKQIAPQLKEFVLSHSFDSYGRKLLYDFPLMVQYLADNTRAGQDGQQAVLRCYLPALAASNLIQATELALAYGIDGPMAPGMTSTTASDVVTAAQALQKQTSLAFDRNTLEDSISLLSQDLGISIELIGADLELEGITRNQSFQLEERNQSAEQILHKILLKANSDGKLVYVIRSDANGRDSIYVTTRAAAAKRGETLPEIFATP